MELQKLLSLEAQSATEWHWELSPAQQFVAWLSKIRWAKEARNDLNIHT